MRYFLIDLVEEIQPGSHATAVKNVTLSENVLHDHFPEYPVYPGSLQVEAMAQLGGFLVETTVNKSEDYVRRAVLGQINKAKFYEPCRPGDQLHLACKIESTLERAVRISATGKVRDKRVSIAELTFILWDIDKPKLHEKRRELYRLWTSHLNLNFPIL